MIWYDGVTRWQGENASHAENGAFSSNGNAFAFSVPSVSSTPEPATPVLLLSAFVAVFGVKLLPVVAWAMAYGAVRPWAFANRPKVRVVG